MHSPHPVSAESTLRGRTARALYHIPAGMCQKTPIRTDREGERTRIRTGGTINTSMPQHRNAKPAPSPAEQVRLPLQWCVYFRALRLFQGLAPGDASGGVMDGIQRQSRLTRSPTPSIETKAIKAPPRGSNSVWVSDGHLPTAISTKTRFASFKGCLWLSIVGVEGFCL